MGYLGDYPEDATVRYSPTTNDGSGGAVAPSSAFEAADLAIYKDGSATQKTTTNGITMTSPFDGTTGLHHIDIDTSNDTGDAGFWAAGSEYEVVLNPDETVDSQTVVASLFQFSIENRSPSLRLGAPVGASISADIAAVKAETALIVADTNELQTDWVDGGRLDLIIDSILVDTAEIGAAGAGLSDLGGMSTTMKAEVNAEVDSALDTAIPGSPTDGSINERLKTQDDLLVKGTVDAGTFTPTTTQFEADDITEATADHYNGRIVIFTSGVLLGQASDITDYSLEGANGRFTVTAMTEAPGDNDTFVIV